MQLSGGSAGARGQSCRQTHAGPTAAPRAGARCVTCGCASVHRHRARWLEPAWRQWSGPSVAPRDVGGPTEPLRASPSPPPATAPGPDGSAVLTASSPSSQSAAAAAAAAPPPPPLPPYAVPLHNHTWTSSGRGVVNVLRTRRSLQSAWRNWLATTAQLLQYNLMVLFRMPTWGKMLALVLVGAPIVLIGSALLRQTCAGLTWHEAIQAAFYVLQNVPGADITRFTEMRARIVLVFIHLLSLYTFATLVSLLTEDVRQTVEDIRSGNFPIPAQSHTVVLDMSGSASHLVAVLQQMLAAREARGEGCFPGGCIAVLSTAPKEDVDRRISDVLPSKGMGIVTRHGNPVKVVDLKRVAAGRAHTVVVLSPAAAIGGVTPMLQQELALAALRSLQPPPPPLAPAAVAAVAARALTAAVVASAAAATAARRAVGSWLGAAGDSSGGGGAPRRQRVIVETTAATVAGGATRVCEGDGALDPLQVTYVSSASSISRVAVQCAAQPGLAAVFDAVIARADETSLHVVPLPAHLAGRPFAELRRLYRSATLCGVLPPRVPQPSAAAAPAAAAASSSSNGNGAGVGGAFGRFVRRSTPAAPDGDVCAVGAVQFAPPDDRLLQRGDQLVLMAVRRSDCTPSLGASAQPPPPLVLGPRHDARRSMPKRIVLLQHDSELAASLLGALEEFAAPGCSVTIVSPEPCVGLPVQGRRSPLRLQTIQGDPLDPLPLLRAGVLEADAVILSGVSELPEDEADSIVTSTAVVLQRLLADPESVTADAAAGVPYMARGRGLGGGGVPAVSASTTPSLMSFDMPYATLAALAAPLGPGQQLQQPGGSNSSGAGGPGGAADGRQEEVGFGGSVGDSSRSSTDEGDELEAIMQEAALAQLAQTALREQQTRRRREGAAHAPNRPLTFVCSLKDPDNRSVLHHVAATACRTAVAAVAAAVASSHEATAGEGAAGSADEGGGRVSVESAAAAAAALGSAARGMTIEVVEPRALVSGMLAQVGADPTVVSGLEDLLDEQGCEIYLKRPDRYGIPPLSRLHWDQVCEVVREAGDVALGYLHRGHLHLAPHASTQLVLVAGDKLVVLSESFL